MAKASDNKFPKLIFTEGSAPASPDAGDQKIFVDSADHHLKLKNASGTVTDLQAGASGDVATDSIWDAKGDLAVGTGPNAASRLAVGTDGQHIEAASGESTGLIWASGGRKLIALAHPSGTNAVSFTSIPSTFSALEIIYTARSTSVGVNVAVILIGFNGDTTSANYRYIMMATSGNGTSYAGEANDGRAIGRISAASSPANSAGSGRITIPFYAGTTFNKQSVSNVAYRYDSSTINEAIQAYSVEWENNAAINRVDLSLDTGNFVDGSVIGLYGLY